MIKILSKEIKNKYYKITHTGCCTFVATKDEFKWTSSPYNEIFVDMICPVCNKQFYGDYKECDKNGNVI